MLAQAALPSSTVHCSHPALPLLPAIPERIIVQQVGMYVAPKWTIPRVIGSIAEQAWARASPQSHERLMVVLASGLVLGEGTASIATAVLKSLFAAVDG
jgi:uncharacterized oligopeptide transporter (OPT) family protein